MFLKVTLQHRESIYKFTNHKLKGTFSFQSSNGAIFLKHHNPVPVQPCRGGYRRSFAHVTGIFCDAVANQWHDNNKKGKGREVRFVLKEGSLNRLVGSELRLTSSGKLHNVRRQRQEVVTKSCSQVGLTNQNIQEVVPTLTSCQSWSSFNKVLPG